MKHILTEKNKDLIYLLKKKKTQKPFHLGEKPGKLTLVYFPVCSFNPIKQFLFSVWFIFGHPCGMTNFPEQRQNLLPCSWPSRESYKWWYSLILPPKQIRSMNLCVLFHLKYMYLLRSSSINFIINEVWLILLSIKPAVVKMFTKENKAEIRP